MPVRFPFLVISISAAALAVSTSWGLAQTEGKAEVDSDVVVQAAIFEPEKLEVKDDQEQAELNKVPEGSTAEIFARDLVNPRMLAGSENDTLYATRRTLEQWAMLLVGHQLGYTAHSAPMQVAFYDGTAFANGHRRNAFVAMRGSWNRRPPSGYELFGINMVNGKPFDTEPFLQCFLIEQEVGGHGYLARLAGIAVGKDGSLCVADEYTGVIDRVSHGGTPSAAASNDASREQRAALVNVVKAEPETPIAIDVVEANGDQAITVRPGSAISPCGGG